MNTLKKIFLMTALTLLGTTALKAQTADSITVKAEEIKGSMYALVDNSFTNKNMFFGMNFGTIPLHQGYLEAGNKDITMSAWTNYSIKDKHLIEIDLLAAYKHTFKLGENTNLTVQPGIMCATFPNSDWPDYRELNLKTTITGLPVDLSLRAGKMYGPGFNSKDITDGSMIDLDISKTCKLSDKLSTTINLETIYNSNYFSGAKGLSHVGGTVSVSYSPIENVIIAGSASAQKKIDPDITCVNSEAYFKAGVTYVFR
jgi:hypothetical protein